MSILVTQSSMPSLEEYVKEIAPIFENHHLTNMGPIHNKFQQQLETYLGVPEVSLVVNGHIALELAIQSLDLCCEGGEVITTPFTFVSTTNAIVRSGLQPVFCDIKPDDYTMDPEKIEALITDKTVAILPVHVYGNLCDVDAIEKIAKKHGLKVIYDAAHAFGVKRNGVGVANFGDASIFSFHATKVFHSVEGGCVTYADPGLRERVDQLKNFGQQGHEDVVAAGGNAKMDEFRAAMGVCNLRHIDESIARRGEVYRRYHQRLSGVAGIRVNVSQEGVAPNYAYYPVYFDETVFGKSRDDVFAALQEHDIFSRKYFYPAINEMSLYKNTPGIPTPVAHDAARRILTLPMYENLALSDVDRICDVILR